MLHESGIAMGTDRTFVPRPLPENPRGFFEDVRFRRVNDLLLLGHGYRVKSWRLPVVSVTKGHLLTPLMRSVIRRPANPHAWGWKDPRQMLTIPPWLEALDDAGLTERTRILLVVRSPLAVAASLTARGGVSTLSHGIALWEAYHRVALGALCSVGVVPKVVEYEVLLSDLAEARNLLGWAWAGCPSGPGRPIDAAVGTALDVQLAHHSPDRAVMSELPHDVRDLYAALRHRASDGG